MKKLFFAVMILIFFIGLFLNGVYAGENNPSVTWNNPTKIRTYIPPRHKYTEKMKRACYRWSTMTKNGIIFKYETSPNNAQIVVYFVEKIPEEFHMDSAAGLTIYSYAVNDGLFRNAKIYITDYAQGHKLTDDEVFTAMLHELGHAIGLGHSNNPNSIMYPTTQHVKTMEVSKEDIDKLAKMYHWR